MYPKEGHSLFAGQVPKAVGFTETVGQLQFAVGFLQRAAGLFFFHRKPKPEVQGRVPSQWKLFSGPAPFLVQDDIVEDKERRNMMVGQLLGCKRFSAE